MHKALLSFVAIGLIFICFTDSYAQVRVAVTPFEAANYSLRKHASYAQGALEDLIMQNFNARVVERARMDKVVEELSMGNFSGLVDPSTSSSFGRMVGAELLITGSLLKADTSQKNFSGLPTGRFRLRTKSSNTEATIRIRAVDVERNEVAFSTIVKGSSSSFSTNFGGSGDRDPVSMAVEHAISKLADDAKFAALFENATSKSAGLALLDLEIAPTPDNCDIEINGVFYGSSPMTIKLDPGITVSVKLSKPGYESWEKKLMPREGMKITSELVKISGN